MPQLDNLSSLPEDLRKEAENVEKLTEDEINYDDIPDFSDEMTKEKIEEGLKNGTVYMGQKGLQQLMQKQPKKLDTKPVLISRKILNILEANGTNPNTALKQWIEEHGMVS